MRAPSRWSAPIVVSVSLACLGFADGRAQICEGVPSLREHAVAAGASFTTAHSGWSAGGNVTFGRAAFVSLAAGQVLYKDFDWGAAYADAHSTALHAGGGYEVERRVSGGGGRSGVTLAACPAAYVEYETGPDRSSIAAFDFDGLTYGLGMGVGAALGDPRRVRIIPYVGVAYVRSTLTMHDVPVDNQDTKDTESGALLDVGIGLVFGRLTVGPAVTFPIGFENTEKTYGVGVSLSLGRGRGTAARQP